MTQAAIMQKASQVCASGSGAVLCKGCAMQRLGHTQDSIPLLRSAMQAPVNQRMRLKVPQQLLTLTVLQPGTCAALLQQQQQQHPLQRFQHPA